jgi:ATP-binding cassette, subfamily B, multidrug efflux pump
MEDQHPMGCVGDRSASLQADETFIDDAHRLYMKPLSRLNHYFWRYKHLFIPGLLCAVVSAVFTITVPIVVRHAVDSIPGFVDSYRLYAGTPLESPYFAEFFVALAGFAAIIIVLSLFSGLFSFLMRQTVVVASRHIEFDLRNRLYNHLQTLPQHFYRQFSTGDMITRATSDIENVRRYIGPAFMYIARAVTLVAIAITVMFIISPTLTLYALIPMPLLGVSVFFMAHMVHSRSDAIQRQYSQVTSHVQEALSGIRVLKAYTRESSEAESFDKEAAAYRKRMLDLALVDSAWRPVFLLLVGLSTVIVVWVGGMQVMEGAITIGNIAEYLIYVVLMTWPVASMGFVITMVQRASASMIRLNEILDYEPDIADDETTDTSIREISGSITFENVSYRYRGADIDALQDISIRVPAGSTLAIVGRTGSGKSTLVEMIPRVIDPTSGTVKIDGRDVRNLPVDVLRTSIGYVPQDVFLFSDTISNNVAFGELDAPFDHIETAAREADLYENVIDFPEGFETFVGERGITLSGGQKQRTSIARAIIRRPPILILDDALSAVDTDTERRILDALRQHYGRRTVVIVSHRISAVQDADHIVVLDEGRIVEQGDHASLLEADGLYADFHRKQLLEQEIDSL